MDESTGLIYQPLEDTSEVVVVSPYEKKVISRFPVAPCKNPHGSAIDPEQKVLFLGCFNQLLAVMDLRTGTLIDTVPIGRLVDVVAWDAGLHRVYTANSAGSMTVVEESSSRMYRAIDTIQTAAGGHTLAVDPQTHRVYVVCSGFRGAQVLVFEPQPDLIGGRMPNSTSATQTPFDARYRRGLEAYASQFQIPTEEVAPWFAEHVGERFGEQSILSASDMWVDNELSLRDRSLVVLSALIAQGGVEQQVRSHTRRAIQHGCTPAQLEDLAMLLAVYTGFPRAGTGLMVMRDEIAKGERGQVNR